MNNTEIKVGQVYIEDMDAGKPPNHFEITWMTEALVAYKTPSGQRFASPRNRFEGLIRAGVFVLKPKEVEASDLWSTSPEWELKWHKTELARLGKVNVELNNRLLGREAQLVGAGKDIDELKSERKKLREERDIARAEISELTHKLETLPVELRDMNESYTRERQSRISAENEVRRFQRLESESIRDICGLKDELRQAREARDIARAELELTRQQKGTTLPLTCFLPDDVFVCEKAGTRVVIKQDPNGLVHYRHRTRGGKVELNCFSATEFKGLIRGSRRLSGRLTDWHCICGRTCRGNGTEHWCVNPDCKFVGEVHCSRGPGTIKNPA